MRATSNGGLQSGSHWLAQFTTPDHTARPRFLGQATERYRSRDWACRYKKGTGQQTEEEARAAERRADENRPAGRAAMQEGWGRHMIINSAS